MFDPNTHTNSKYDLVDNDHFEIQWFSGTGKGGQHRNRHQNCCRVKHIPTGLIETEQGRKRESNLRNAKQRLLLLLAKNKQDEHNNKISENVNKQIGSGMRGDKIRTYRFQEDRVIDHRTGKTGQIKRMFRGNFDVMWK